MVCDLGELEGINIVESRDGNAVKRCMHLVGLEVEQWLSRWIKEGHSVQWRKRGQRLGVTFLGGLGSLSSSSGQGRLQLPGKEFEFHPVGNGEPLMGFEQEA